MNRNFKYYTLIWTIFLVVFNVICFVTPNKVAGMSKFGGAFWAGYIFISIAFIGQLVCAYIALYTNDRTRLFYHIPIIHISYIGLILTVIFGALCMAVPNLPNWIGIIACLLVLAFTAVAAIKAKAAADIVKDLDESEKAGTLFIKSLTADAENLLSRAATAETKEACKKVFEAARYSDPISNDALAGIESQITLKFNEFSAAVTGGTAPVGNLADALVALIESRNKKCKLLK